MNLVTECALVDLSNVRGSFPPRIDHDELGFRPANLQDRTGFDILSKGAGFYHG